MKLHWADCSSRAINNKLTISFWPHTHTRTHSPAFPHWCSAANLGERHRRINYESEGQIGHHSLSTGNKSTLGATFEQPNGELKSPDKSSCQRFFASTCKLPDENWQLPTKKLHRRAPNTSATGSPRLLSASIDHAGPTSTEGEPTIPPLP